MKLLRATILFSLLAGSTLNAQFAGQAPISGDGGAQGTSQGLIAYTTGSVLEKRNKKIDFDDFQGSPYTNNEFQPTTLLDGDKEVGRFYYRYNAYNGEIELKATPNDESISGLARDKKLAVLKDGKRLSFKTFIDKGNNTLNGYLTELIKGDPYSLYERTKVKFTEGSPAANSFVKAIPSRFSKFTEYYIEKSEGNRIDEIELSNRKILKLLDGKDKEKIKTYFKENKVKVRTIDDLIKLVELLNQ